VPIDPRETATTLHDKLAAAGAAAVVRVCWRLVARRRADATPQPAAGATYAAKVERADAVIDLVQARRRDRPQIRAFDPVPGAATHFGAWPSRSGAPIRLRVESAARRAASSPTTTNGIDVAIG
jgi:methionyl-tRNA formyltransferase